MRNIYIYREAYRAATPSVILLIYDTLLVRDKS